MDACFRCAWAAGVAGGLLAPGLAFLAGLVTALVCTGANPLAAVRARLTRGPRPPAHRRSPGVHWL